jgi:hypothetical protein
MEVEMEMELLTSSLPSQSRHSRLPMPNKYQHKRYP